MVTAAGFLLAADGQPAGEIAVGLVLMGLGVELALRVDSRCSTSPSP